MNSSVENIDCMEGMKRYPDKWFDLAICDVPYGIGVGKMSYLQEIKNTVKQKNGSRLNSGKKTSYAVKQWDDKPPTQEYYNELVRVSKQQIIFGVEYVDWAGVGFGRIKWNKGVPEKVSFKGYEMAYCSIIDGMAEICLLWSGMCQAYDLLHPMRQQGNKRLNEKRIHPTHKPTLLYKKLLQDYAKTNDKILDTHLGSGSSRIAAYDGGFDFTGFELDKDYYEAQEKRFAGHLITHGNMMFKPKAEIIQPLQLF